MQHRPDLVLLRHGESTANACGLFTGVWDVPLTTHGRAQAARAATLMVAAGIDPTLILASPLIRAVQTVEALRREGGWDSKTVLCSELTERGYGALTGLRKAVVADLVGAEQAHLWRRGLTQRPPRLDEVSWHAMGEAAGSVSTIGTEQAVEVAEAALVAESFSEVLDRVSRWQAQVLLPALRQGASALVVAHGNSLRALVAILDQMATDEIESLNIPTGEPVRYLVAPSGIPIPGARTYLDPSSAQLAIHEVEREGGT